MIDENTDFFKIINNFEKIKNTPSLNIIKSSLNYKPRVTIAIPTYKRPELLKESIFSAINQKRYYEYDIIVVDNDPIRDCDTEKLMHTFNDKRLSYYKNKDNIGMAGNWNRLFELADGDYVVMLHDDDLLLSSFLSECMTFLEENKSEIGIIKPFFHSFYDTLNETELQKLESDSNNIIGKSWTGKYKRIYDIDNCLSFALGAPTGCLFKKDAVVEIGGYNNDFYPSLDYCFAILFSRYYKVYVLKKTLSLYRWSKNESLNYSTRKAFVIDAYYIRKTIFNIYKFPQYIINGYLSWFIESHRDLNIDFDLHINILNTASTKKSKSYSSFIWFYINIIKFIKYKIGLNIWDSQCKNEN